MELLIPSLRVRSPEIFCRSRTMHQIETALPEQLRPASRSVGFRVCPLPQTPFASRPVAPRGGGNDRLAESHLRIDFPHVPYVRPKCPSVSRFDRVAAMREWGVANCDTRCRNRLRRSAHQSFVPTRHRFTCRILSHTDFVDVQCFGEGQPTIRGKDE